MSGIRGWADLLTEDFGGEIEVSESDYGTATSDPC